MEAAFGWIQAIWNFIVSLLPHPYLIKQGWSGIKHKSGVAMVLKPKRYWYVPFFTEIDERFTSRQTTPLDAQVIWCQDKEIAVSPTVVYEINNPYKALVLTDDIDDALSDVTWDAVIRVVGQYNWADLRKAFVTGQLKEQLTCELNLQRFGVSVEVCFLSELCSDFHRMIGRTDHA